MRERKRDHGKWLRELGPVAVAYVDEHSDSTHIVTYVAPKQAIVICMTPTVPSPTRAAATAAATVARFFLALCLLVRTTGHVGILANPRSLHIHSAGSHVGQQQTKFKKGEVNISRMAFQYAPHRPRISTDLAVMMHCLNVFVQDMLESKAASARFPICTF